MTDLHVDELITSRLPWREVGIVAAACLVVLAITFASGYAAGQRKVATQATQNIDAANVATGEAYAFKAQAEALTQTEQSDKAKVAASDRDSNGLKLKLAKTLRELDAANAGKCEPIAVVDGNTPAISPAVVVADLKDQVIAAQDAQIKTRDALILTLGRKCDFQTLRGDALERESLNLRAAIAAKDGLIRGALWKGRIQGLAIGIASGYVAGRLH